MYTHIDTERERERGEISLSLCFPSSFSSFASLSFSFTLTRSFILPFGESRFLLPSIDFPLIYLDSKTMTRESRGAVGIGK